MIVLSGKGTFKQEECVRVRGMSEVIEKRFAPHSFVNILGRMTNHRRSERTPTAIEPWRMENHLMMRLKQLRYVWSGSNERLIYLENISTWN
jgi:hypothetical protein